MLLPLPPDTATAQPIWLLGAHYVHKDMVGANIPYQIDMAPSVLKTNEV